MIIGFSKNTLKTDPYQAGSRQPLLENPEITHHLCLVLYKEKYFHGIEHRQSGETHSQPSNQSIYYFTLLPHTTKPRYIGINGMLTINTNIQKPYIEAP